MKKYILLAGVALATMTANNAMSAALSSVDGIQFNAKASIVKPAFHTCSDLNFGTIVLKNGSGPATVVVATDSTVTTTGEILTVGKGVGVGSDGYAAVMTQPAAAQCELDSMSSLQDDITGASIELSGYNMTTTSTVTVSNLTLDNAGYAQKIGGTLTIEDVSQVKTGEYTGTFTFYKTY